MTRDWIPVEERLPEQEVAVIAHDGDMVTPAKYFGEDGWFNLASIDMHDWYEQLPYVTHWRYLPEPPKGDCNVQTAE